MSELEFVGKINPRPFISIAKEEEMRIEEIKKRVLKEKLKSMLTEKSKVESELTYERDIQEDC